MPNTAKRMDVRQMVTLAILAAMAYVVMLVGRIPITSVDFLKYDPKDVIIAIAALIYGPFPAFLMSLVVSIIEMFTVSTSGPWGLLMNVLSTCSFACFAGFVYQKKRTAVGAALGLVGGALLMTGAMLLWNYYITPIYMGLPREAVAAMLPTVFLPFNLVKSGLNAALTLLLYKPLVTALRRTNALPQQPQQEGGEKPMLKMNTGVLLVAAVLLASCVLYVLVTKGVI